MHPFSPSRLLSPDQAVSGGFFTSAKLRSAVSPWVRFTWQTPSLAENLPGAASTHLIRPAIKEESGKVLDAMMQSFSMDSAWNDSLLNLESYFKNAVNRIFSEAEPLCLVIPKGNRFIAASLLDVASCQLLSGPLVLMEYRNRGIGSRLLHASLVTLRDHGLSTVSGVTRVNTIVSRHIYPKFGGVSESIQWPSPVEAAPEAKS